MFSSTNQHKKNSLRNCGSRHSWYNILLDSFKDNEFNQLRRLVFHWPIVSFQIISDANGKIRGGRKSLLRFWLYAESPITGGEIFPGYKREWKKMDISMHDFFTNQASISFYTEIKFFFQCSSALISQKNLEIASRQYFRIFHGVPLISKINF